jgi:putative hydroxymethylpyrimidine transport system ATP-binding protein
VLRISDLNLSYPGYDPLATVSLEIKTGDQIALLGRSGTGKSTLLAAIINGAPEIERQTDKIAYIAQEPALLPWATTIDNVLLGFRLRGETITTEHQSEAQRLLDEVELGHLSNRKTSLLSGGQKARVALARVLIEDADLILLDEPFSGLDRSTRIQMANLCQKLLVDKTLILVTHDPRDAHNWLETAMVLTTESMTGPHALDTFDDDQTLVQALDGTR